MRNFLLIFVLLIASCKDGKERFARVRIVYNNEKSDTINIFYCGSLYLNDRNLETWDGESRDTKAYNIMAFSILDTSYREQTFFWNSEVTGNSGLYFELPDTAHKYENTILYGGFQNKK